MTFIIALICAGLVSLALWTPHSLHRLVDRRVSIIRKKSSMSEKAVLNELIQRLRAGQLPATALEQINADVADHIGTLLEVCVDSGAQAVPALQLLKESISAREQLQRQVAAEIAAPKATVLLLAVLPIFAWWLGSMLGAAPLQWLLGSGWGMLTFAIGISMEISGVVAIFVMASRVQDMA